MNIEVKYNIGDKIKFKTAQQLDEYETCSFCNGNKQIQGADNTVLPCPKCNGRGITRKVLVTDKIETIYNIMVSYNSMDMGQAQISYQIANGAFIQQDDIIGVVNS